MNLVSIGDLDERDIKALFLLAKDYKKFPKHKYSRKLKNHILANLFYEPSTRTSSSFAAAMFNLGGSVIPINDVTYSSVTKGENLEDTVRTMGCFCDVIVLRSQNAGDAAFAADVSSVPLINAGDGSGEHPTQTLLDLFTIHEKFGKLENLTITFAGDIGNSRTIHSLKKVLHAKNNCNYLETYDVENLPPSDVYYLTRVQRERVSTGSYQLTKEHVDNMPEESIVMHPFPRNDEIPKWFDSDPRAHYFEQMQNGLWIRMALLTWVL